MEKSLKEKLYRIAIDLYAQGPIKSNIWKRSGGDLSFLYLGQPGRDAWYEALDRLTNGGGGEITPQSLVQEMLTDFPKHRGLIELQNNFQSESHFVEKTDRNINDEAEYIAENQPWFVKDFPATENITFKNLSQLISAVEIIIFTVTDIELKYALSYLKPLETHKDIIKGVNNSETYYVGRFGVFNTVITKCQMGVTGVGSATLASEEGMRFWQPIAAFMVGIAFGKDSHKQHLGQVLIANSIIPYEIQRVGEDVTSRGISLSSNANLLNRFEHSYNWKFLLPNGEECKMQFGSLLSGEKLVDDLKFKNDLFSRHPNAIGGEMEGAGFYAAAQRKGIPCILLKSICDWGDGQKHKKHQPLAAATATSLLYSVLSQEDSLNVLLPSDTKPDQNNLSKSDSSVAHKSGRIVASYRKKLMNRTNIPSDDFELLSLITFLELVENEFIEKYSLEKWKKMESAFHRGMRRGPSSNLNNDELESPAKHEFIRIAKKNYLNAEEGNKDSEQEFEDLWQAVKENYRMYH